MTVVCRCNQLDCKRYGCQRTRGPIEVTSTVFESETNALDAITDAAAAEEPFRLAEGFAFIEGHADVTERFQALFGHLPPASISLRGFRAA